MNDPQGEPRSRTWLILLLATLTTLGLLLFELFVERQNAEAHRLQERNQARENLALLQNRLEGYLRGTTMMVRGMVSVIATNPKLDQAEFARAARPLIGGQSQLRNIAGAPDMVIRFMYPLAGNEKALGLDYRKTPTQRAAAERARQTGEIVLAGPLELAQGGIALIARFPVFTDAGEAGTRFWGLISAVIDVDRLYRDSGLLDDTLPIAVAMRGKDAKGINGEVFFGDASVFQNEPVLMNVALPNGFWQLAAQPQGGWAERAPNVWRVRGTFVLLGLAVVGSLLLLALLEQRRYQVELRLRQTLRDLEQANVAAEAGSHAKSEFLATIGHEIRTPMHGVLGMADLLLSTQLDEEQKGFVQTLKKSAKALLEVINQILEYSRLDAGRLKLVTTDFLLAEQVEAVCDLLRPEAEAKGLRLESTCPSGPPPRVFGDAGHIRQVLHILVGNAIKFTDAGRVELVVGWHESETGQAKFRFEVMDTGIGIAPEVQAELFAPFTQAADTMTRRHGGTGLGLAKAKLLVEAMGGAIGVRSMPGQGACFWFELNLPLGTDADAKGPGAALSRSLAENGDYGALPLLDNASLENLVRATGLSARELLAMLRDELVQAMAAIDAACAARDGEAVVRQARNIKTTCQQLGALRLAALMRAAETVDCRACNSDCQGLMANCRNTLDELNAEIDARSAC
jgi:sensor domain CHASE-containing protein